MTRSPDCYKSMKQLLTDFDLFCKVCSGLTLRSYQRKAAHTILQSVLRRRGLSITVMFPRQSGKNEIQAQIEAYLLLLLSQREAEIVKISPTWKPQSFNAMRRLERVLERNVLTRGRWQKEQGYIYRLGRARIYFFSGQPEANIVSATAGTLLEVDEAQDILIKKYDRDIAPMAASTNATRVFWGTAWTNQTLLFREADAARTAEKRDKQPRVFRMTADEVGREVNEYRKFVDEQVARFGRQHPMVKSQYFSEEITGQGGLFPAERLERLQGQHESHNEPQSGFQYAFLLDIAGEDESSDPQEMNNPRRDLTALTVVTCSVQPESQFPVYRAVHRKEWIGVKHHILLPELNALIAAWRPRYVVVDATGVGAGLSSFLSKNWPDRVIPFVFSSASKSQLGWDFLSVCDTGRWQEPHTPSALDRKFLQQCSYCQFRVQEGPGKLMKWGVPDGSRETGTGETLHDDLLVSAALSAVLDRQDWPAGGETLIINGFDPLDEMDRTF